MLLNVTVDLSYSAMQACDALLQIEAVTDCGQRCESSRLLLMSGIELRLVAGEDGIGQRRWVSITTQLQCRYETQVQVSRLACDISQIKETPRYQLPDPVISYLMPSRNCQSDLFLDFVSTQFEGLAGGALVLAMRDWVATHFTYDINVSNSGTTATDSFQSLRGVCRDYAHVLIALARAAGIPTRYVAAYAPNVTPQDFHAVVEVFLDGAWHLVDATGMAQPTDIVRICVGRDAADTSFLTSYGTLALVEQNVQVRRVTH
jgi:transglutaminase-like putative cysteine protease